MSALAASRSDSQAATFTNPFITDSADPWVFQHKGRYFHTRSGFFGLPTVDRSVTLQGLSAKNGPVIWSPPSGTMYSSGHWAPETHYLDGKWYTYVAGDDGNNANHRMYVLEGNSQDPQGTYEFKGKIAPATDRWAIDGSVFEHGGQRYFTWSGWAGTTNVRQDIYIARMSNPWTLSTDRVLISQPDYTWEKRTGGIVAQGINEAPQVIQRNGKLFIIYSASLFADQQYCLGQLEFIGGDILSNAAWSKKPTPVFTATADVKGPGHPSFVKSPDGSQDWMVYHAHNLSSHFDERRNVHAKSFTFNADGTPNFGSPVSPGVAVNEPSGRAVATFIPNCGFDRADVRSASSAGTANGVESMGNRGVVGVVDNRGRFFNPIADGDGAQVGFINAVGDNGIFYDVGQIYDAGTYSFSAGFALSSNQATVAALGPGNFRLVLESVGRDANGNPIESDKVTLAQATVNSSAWNSSSFTYFNTTGGVALGDNRLDSILRVGVYNTLTNAVNWSAKIDKLDLTFTPAIGWQRDAGGDWSAVSNWSGGVPSGLTAVAKFTSAITGPRTINLDSPRTVGSLIFDNASTYMLSGNTLTLDSASSSANVSVLSGSHTIAATMSLMKDTTINVAPAASVLTIGTSLSVGANVKLTKIGAGEVVLRNVRTSGLEIDAGTVRVAANGSATGTSRVTNLAIDPGAALDLADNNLIVRGVELGAWDNSKYTGVSGMIGDGRITTSGVKSLAIASSADVKKTSFAGFSVSPTDVLVMYTFVGDADLSGGINADDYFQIDSNINKPAAALSYFKGDFDLNGVIDGDDYHLIDQSYTSQFAAGVATVPEPASLASMAVAGALAAMPRRRGRRISPAR